MLSQKPILTLSRMPKAHEKTLDLQTHPISKRRVIKKQVLNPSLRQMPAMKSLSPRRPHREADHRKRKLMRKSFGSLVQSLSPGHN